MEKSLCFLVFVAFAWQVHGLELESVKSAISNLFSESSNAIDVCRLPKDPGPCDALIKRFYFNHETGQCEEFIYGGCKGNANNFRSKEECQLKCLKEHAEEEHIPRGFKCGEDGLHAHHQNCSSFIQCVNGEPHLMACPEGLHFSNKTHECVRACDAHCDKTLACRCHWSTCGKEVCFLPPKAGPCKAAINRYFFDKRAKTCKTFTYGGCRGNENNFETKEACESQCGGAMDVDEDKCRLKADPGPCRGYFPKFFYNIETKQCEEFIYGGCEGNANKYNTKEECEKSCLKEEGASGEHRDVCQQPKKPGPCKGAIPRFFFNHKTGKCEEFIYGGCQRNGNNFQTKEECEKRCSKKEDEDKPVDVCRLPKLRGPCRASIPRYFFNRGSGKCEEFIYGGCKGNGNNFESKEDCEKRCLKKEEDASGEHLEVCQQPKYPGPCKGAFPRFFFNHETGKCEEFIYGGCQRNGNNFQTKEECERRCSKKDEKPVDICRLPKEPGPCKGGFRKYFFNHETGQCELFIYGGCRGNANNFQTKEECEKRCPKQEESTVDVCQMPKDKGPCRGHIVAWWYNYSTKKCERFVYGGCQGNANRFGSTTECEARCGKKSAAEDLDADFECGKDGLYPNKRNCSTYIQCSNGRPIIMPCPKGLHYSVKTSRCEGPCEARCDRTLACQCKWETCGKRNCLLSADSGSCKAYKARYYYNRETGLCSPFLYSGCLGNENNFQKKSDCEKTCNDTINVCRLEPASGNCYAKIDRFYFNSKKRKCEKFIWGGCGGNANNFVSIKACQSKCMKKPGGAMDVDEDKCRLKADPGPCRGYFPKFFYNIETKQCEEFIYGGCEGNANKYNTKEECEKSCLKEEASRESKFGCIQNGTYGDPEDCNQYIDCYTNGTNVYHKCPSKQHWSVALKRCTPECEAYCDPSIACKCNWPNCKHGESASEESSSEDFSKEEITPECDSPPEVGGCFAKMTRWNFDKKTGKCHKFLYGGCGGNGNNYLSEAECLKHCSKHSDAVEDRSSEEITRARNIVSAVPEFCKLPVEVGPCSNQIEKYYFDSEEGECKAFNYSGCGGNLNSFWTKELCERTCKRDKKEESSSEDATVKGKPIPECDSTPEKGQCFAKLERWNFDKKTGKCIKFLYGGCGGNGNNYLTKAQCEKQCSKHSEELTCPEPEGDFPYHLNCKKYISCKDDKPKLKDCPAKLAFDFLLRKCVPIDEAACAR